MVEIIHAAVKGRARYKVDPLHRSPPLKHYLEQQLAAYEGITSVSANPMTGTVLVQFRPEVGEGAIATEIEKLVKQWQQQAGETEDRPAASARGLTPAEPEAQTDTTWHLTSLEDILKEFGTSETSGLAADAAAQGLQRYGPNLLAEAKGRSDWSMVVEQFTTWPVGLLSAAAVLSGFTGGLVDAAVIMGVVGINAVIGYVTESQSERIIRSLQQGESPLAMVRRDGREITLDAAEIVPGDVLILRSGNPVAADARLVTAENLYIDESALTGESVPVEKRAIALRGDLVPLAERVNMVFQGTLITGGSGTAVVVATGQATEIGKIQRLVGETIALDTPLQRQLDEVSGQLVVLCGGICAAIFGIGALRGYGLLELLKTSISLAVAAVPEGLPTVATTTLALGIQNMRQRKILIRALNAVEALGSLQVVCLDKTGTITQNRMVVQEVDIATGALQVDGARETLLEATFIRADQSPVQPQAGQELHQLLQVGVLCSESEISRGDDGQYRVTGSPTENALVYLAIAAGLDVQQLRQRYPLLRTNLRSDNRNLMSTVHRIPSGKLWMAVKGSPAEVLERCTRWMDGGEVKPLTQEQRQALGQANQQMADKALRVLGMAYRNLGDGENDGTDGEQDLTWLGLVGLADPIRSGVPELMTEFHRAGIDTVMVTGDQSATAYAIGRQLNLNRDQQLEILDAYDLSNLAPDELRALADKVDIFARISPADKLQIVRALQSAGKIVAMTGDGINDTPALKAANVGLAMGSGRADVVHEVADVVIQDDNLGTLIDAVSQGRTIYNNIRKSVHFLLATNLSEIMVTAIATILGLGQPMNAIQLLWLNLVTDVFPGLGLALEPPEPDVLDRPPRSPEERIIQQKDFQRITVEAGVLSLSALMAYGYGIGKYGIGAKASTIVFMSLTIGQVLHTLSCRSETHRWFDPGSLPRNPYLEAAVLGSLGLQLLPLVVPGLGGLLKIAPLDGLDFLVIVLAAILPLLINEGTKPQPQSSESESNISDHVSEGVGP
jgi:Ca2+-transporting ATPase